MKHHCEQIIKIPLKSDYLNAYEILVFLRNNQFDQSIGTMPQKMLKKILFSIDFEQRRILHYKGAVMGKIHNSVHIC